MGNHYRKAGGEEFVRPCPLIFAGPLYHRVVINREAPMRVARDLGLSKPAAVGVLRIVKYYGGVPSLERLALIAMRIPDVTDEDISEWFGEPVGWARAVRKTADSLRQAEPIPEELEYIDDGYQPEDPTPEQIREMMVEIRRKEDRWATVEPAPVEIRSYQWSGTAYASIQNCPELRPQGRARVGGQPASGREERGAWKEVAAGFPQQKHRPLRDA